MISKTIRVGMASLAVAMITTVAFAHTGVGQTSGFTHGFGHPISGPDHILATVMVGMFAWQLGGRALWLGIGVRFLIGKAEKYVSIVVRGAGGIAAFAGVGPLIGVL